MITPHTTKIKTLSQLSRIVKKLKNEGKTIVHCHGVFDLIHPGHIRYFTSAKKHGDILMVTLVADLYVKKGPDRPVFTQELRSEVLASIELIDYVTIVNSSSAIDTIKLVRPHVFVLGPQKTINKKNSHADHVLDDVKAAVRLVGCKLIVTDDISFSSSHLINTYLDVYPPKTKEFIQAFRKKYSDELIIAKLSELQKLKILVIGDTIIDQYVYSKPLGKSTKEPIVVHKFLEEESYAGGTLATANNVGALCDTVTLVTLLGEKKSYEHFVRQHMRERIKLKLFFHKDIRTIVKRRYIDEVTKQKLFQISYIDDDVRLSVIERSMVVYLKAEIPKYDFVIINDFGHGVLTKKIIRAIYSKAKYVALNVQANSANYGYNIVTKYPRANFICIDEQEIRLATHNRYEDLPNLIKRVFAKMKCQHMIITRGPYGSNSYSTETGLLHVPALTQKVVDRVGAGDALFAISSPCIYAGMDLLSSTFLGNIAGAMQVATIGNKTPIDSDELMKFITRLLK